MQTLEFVTDCEAFLPLSLTRTIFLFLFSFLFLVAFHEAIGDAIGLSIASPKHLQTLGLVQRSVDDVAHDINFLFSLAMEKVRYNFLVFPIKL